MRFCPKIIILKKAPVGKFKETKHFIQKPHSNEVLQKRKNYKPGTFSIQSHLANQWYFFNFKKYNFHLYYRPNEEFK